MNQTFAFLFNTHDSPLHTQLSSELWSMIYDMPEARARDKCWATKQFVYTRRRLFRQEREEEEQLERRLRELERNEISLSSALLGPLIVAQTQLIERFKRKTAHARHLIFPCPMRNKDPENSMVFEVQQDSCDCPVHALNNIARRVIFSPPDMRNAIECLRTLDVPFTAPEEVVLAALSEGIFLLVVKLTDVNDLVPLDTNASVPKEKNFLKLLTAAGGMIVYRSLGVIGMGHYVSLVACPDEWVVYSTDSVVSRAPSASDALDYYISMALGGTSQDAQLLRAQRLEQRHESTHQFIGLMPVNLEPLFNSSAPVTQVTLMLRTLVRRQLSELRVTSPSERDGTRDLFFPEAVSPCALEELGWFMRYIGDAPPACRFNGYEATNVASFALTRHSVYAVLNRNAASLAHSVMNESCNALFVENLSKTVRSLRSYLQRAIPVLGLLFMGSVEDAGGVDVTEPTVERSGDFMHLMTNRRWFRLVALTLALSPVCEYVELLSESKQNNVSTEMARLLTLISVCCYNNLRAYGAEPPGALAALFTALRDAETRDTLLPMESMPEAMTDVFDEPTEFEHVVGFAAHDVSIWLLRASLKIGSAQFVFTKEIIDAFELTPEDETATENTAMSTDSRAQLVALIRRTLFRLPLAGADYDAVLTRLSEQQPFEYLDLARHNKCMLHAFLREAHETHCLSDEDARTVVDVLAYDQRYEFEGTALLPEDEDSFKARPRFVAFAARTGFQHIHKQVFGALSLEDDGRRCCTVNMNRVTPPRTIGQWRTAEARVEKGAELCTSPLTELIEVHDRYAYEYRAPRSQRRSKSQFDDDGGFTTVTRKQRNGRFV